MRTAIAARAWLVVLVVSVLLCVVVSLPGNALAQQPQGAGAPVPSNPQTPLSQPPAAQPTEPQPAEAQAPQAPQSENAKPQTQPPAPEKAKPSKAKGKISAAAEQSSANETLAQFAWLAGRWQGDWGPRIAQQVWMPPKSGVMVGVFQLTEDAQTLVIELYTITATPQGIELRVRHFTPTLTAWQKDEPSSLKLMTYDSKSFLFVNQDNGQPKHWLMKRNDPNTYVARFEIVPEQGESETAEITYRRQASPAPATH